jgi:hypothetical protein
MGKLRFFAQFKAKWADSFTQPQSVTIFLPQGDKTNKKSTKIAKNALFLIFGGHLNCLIAKMFR